MANAHTINIFLPDGDPEGLRVITKAGFWPGKAIVFPRSGYPQARSRKELQQPGVYVLVGQTEDDETMIYVGEGDPVGPRIANHQANKDFWTWCIFFCAADGSLNKAVVQYLESTLVARALDAKRVLLDNSQTPTLPFHDEASKALGDSFVSHMMDVFPLVGLDAFEKPKPMTSKRNMLNLSGRDAAATGYETTGGFVVQKGSRARKTIATHAVKLLEKKFEKLVEKGIFKDDPDNPNSFLLTQDYEFSAPSTAAAHMLARNAAGTIEWKDAAGKTLKKIQEERAAID